MYKLQIDDIHPFLSKIVQDIDLDKDYYLSTNNYEWYYSFGKYFKPTSILELGVRFGYSACSMMHGSECVIEYVGVDWEEIPNSNSIAYNNIKMLFPDVSITILKQDTNKLTHSMINNKTFDLIHLDACHKENIIQEFDITWNMLKKDNGIMIIDDMFSYYTHIGLGGNRELTAVSLINEKIDELYFNGEILSVTKLNTFRGTYILQKKTQHE